MISQSAVVFAIFVAFLLVGCASTPPMQWWRVGNCLVLFEQGEAEKQLVAVGQNCDIKRDTITAQGKVK